MNPETPSLNGRSGQPRYQLYSTATPFAGRTTNHLPTALHYISNMGPTFYIFDAEAHTLTFPSGKTVLISSLNDPTPTD